MRYSLFALGAFLTPPAIAGAQGTYGIAGGFNFSGPGHRYESPVGPLADTYSRGIALQQSFEWRVSGRASARLDGFLTRFDLREWTYQTGLNCGAVGYATTCPYYDALREVTVAGLVTSGVVDVVPSFHGARVYLLAGVGAYFVNVSNGSQGAVRPGLSAGAGWAVPTGSGSRVFMEARYHYVLNAPNQPVWLAPVAFGIQFQRSGASQQRAPIVSLMAGAGNSFGGVGVRGEVFLARSRMSVLAGAGIFPGSPYNRTPRAGATSLRYYAGPREHRFFVDASWSLVTMVGVDSYAGYEKIIYGPGLSVGYSFMSRSGLTVTAGGGLGRDPNANNPLPMAQLGIGWTWWRSPTP